MKIRLEPSEISDDEYFHMYLNDEHISYQNKEKTVRKVVGLIMMSNCNIEIEKVRNDS